MIYLGADKHGLKVIKIVENYLSSKNVKLVNLSINKEGQDIKLEDLIPKITKKN